MSTITLLAITAPTPYNKDGSLRDGVKNETWVGLSEANNIGVFDRGEKLVVVESILSGPGCLKIVSYAEEDVQRELGKINLKNLNYGVQATVSRAYSYAFWGAKSNIEPDQKFSITSKQNCEIISNEEVNTADLNRNNILREALTSSNWEINQPDEIQNMLHLDEKKCLQDAISSLLKQKNYHNMKRVDDEVKEFYKQIPSKYTEDTRVQNVVSTLQKQAYISVYYNRLNIAVSGTLTMDRYQRFDSPEMTNVAEKVGFEVDHFPFYNAYIPFFTWGCEGCKSPNEETAMALSTYQRHIQEVIESAEVKNLYGMEVHIAWAKFFQFHYPFPPIYQAQITDLFGSIPDIEREGYQGAPRHALDEAKKWGNLGYPQVALDYIERAKRYAKKTGEEIKPAEIAEIKKLADAKEQERLAWIQKIIEDI